MGLLWFLPARTQPKLPDLTILQHNNYSVQGIAENIFPYDRDSIGYNCPIANIGKSVFICPRYYLQDFLEVSEVKIETGRTWNFYKSKYDFSTDCLRQDSCVNCNSNNDTMCIGVYQYDTYFITAYTDSAGTYAVRAKINANKRRQFKESSYQNNIVYFAFRYFWNGVAWVVQVDNTLLTKQIENVLDHL